jgi:cupin fold WbuC family metalloprotein
MEQIYSNVEPGLLLHLVNRLADIKGRTDISPDDQFIQLATLRMEKGATFKPHKHIWKPTQYKQHIAQESWCVIQGRVLVSFYDTDGTLLVQKEIGPGDCSMTFQGGHNYLALEEDTVVYEYKTGPYYGYAMDKVQL